ncbi:ROK family transcriptional regulator [Streptomyces sp. DSM 41982]|uniref:ROK family transcriptional regulator n=1 Tax=Streptomyces evansiae TaxID=3075535 RepID=A0ABD5E800_9ACTN|nr:MULTISPECIES: ROK family transcriptional regulator [unclassified Streptomyces]MDT0416902.1 ROK family transcriptional regulator [Streptomyces sp. DSM 41982]SCD65507.1 Sugar kinase of the NBD/HSP70 family, may contain an N-terminal HTH domain [Streptomyces sp. SolWspMP-sol7th]
MAVRGTPSWLGDQNAATALRLLLDHGPLSRNGVGERSGLSRPTATQMIARLEDKGLIEVVGEESIGRGPRAALYGVRNDLAYGVAINVDQEGVRSTVVDLAGTRHPVAHKAAAGMPAHRGAARDVARAVLDACEAADVDLTAIRHIRVGVPSSVDPRHDELSSVAALPGWSRKSIRRQLEGALGCEVEVDNDVNLAAIAERATGPYSPAGTFALLWVGYGIGLAVDVAGTVLRGASGGAGEIGNLPVPHGVPGADDGARDLEGFLGARALDRIGRETGWAEDGFARVLAGETLPERVCEVYAPRLAQSVIPVLGVVDPEVVVLGGPVGRAGGERLVELTTRHLREHTRWDPDVRLSAVAGDAVLDGARTALGIRLREALLARATGSLPAADHARVLAERLRDID